MVVYAETALEKDAPTATDLAHQEVAGIAVQIMYRHVLAAPSFYGNFLWNQAMILSADDDDDETCGFCIFMKAGGCKDEFKVRLLQHVGIQSPIVQLCT